MDTKHIKAHLDKHGWCVVPNVLSNDEIVEAKRMFYEYDIYIKKFNFIFFNSQKQFSKMK